MNVAEFCRRFSSITGWPQKDLDQRVRRLREARMLPRGAGRHSPDITPEQAVTVLIGVGASDNITKVPPFTEILRNLTLSIEDLEGLYGYVYIETEEKIGELKFSDVLKQMILDPDWTYKHVKEVTICRTSAMATISFNAQDEIFAVYKKRGTIYPLVHCGCTFRGSVLSDLGVAMERLFPHSLT